MRSWSCPWVSREVDDVHPVPGPALAVMGARQQAIDQPLVGVGRPIVEERRDLLGGRRQPDQVEGEPADQRAPVGLARRPQALLRQLGEDESVDRRCGPAGHRRLDRRDGRPADRPERPPVAALAGTRGRCRCRRLARSVARVGRTHLDPSAEVGDHRGGELRLGGHRLVAVGRRDRLEEDARLGVPRHDRRTRAAPLRIPSRVSSRNRPFGFASARNGTPDTVPPGPGGSCSRRRRCPPHRRPPGTYRRPWRAPPGRARAADRAGTCPASSDSMRLIIIMCRRLLRQSA